MHVGAMSRICLASLWLTCTVRDNLRKVLDGIVVRLYFYFWGSTVLILEIQKVSSRTANNATLFNNTIICHLGAMQIEQQCLGRMQHWKCVEAMQMWCLTYIYLLFYIFSVSEL